MEIRERREGDLDALVVALAAVAKVDGYPSRWPDDPAAWLRTRDPIGAWVVEHDGEPAGQIVLRPGADHVPARMWHARSGEAPQSCCVVSRLFVGLPARGHGAGSALMHTAWAAASERGLRPMLDVVDANQSAIRLYRGLGWIHLGTYVERFYDDGPDELLHCFAAPSTEDDRSSARPGT
jgi:GNAT superfamily N-acetyltransferase